MIYIAYSIEMASLIVCAAVLNMNGCPVMGWTMLVLAAGTTIKRSTKPEGTS